MTAPVLTLEEEDYLCEQADLLHAREAEDKAHREEALCLVAEWVVA